MRSLTSRFAAALITMFAVACSEPTAVQSHPRPSGFRRASLTTGKPALYPNSRKYRDVGYKAAVGRSGSATVSMRALLGASGRTDVELSTGSFDDGSVAASGTLATVQVKSQANGAPFTSNQTSLNAPTASFPFTGMAHGTPVNVQAVVRGAGSSRTDVVNVSDVVRLRPDLVADIEGPAGAPVGGAVNFFAAIGERLGELGARASCVAYVDGVAVDRADNVWIDAGSWVGCIFTHAFATKGTHTVEIRVENVQPADFDNSNNSASTTIHVEDPNGFAAYSFEAHDYNYSSSFRNQSLWNGVLYDQTTTSMGREQYFSIVGLIPRALDLPIRLHGEFATNGSTFDVTDETYDAPPFVEWQPGYCDYRSSFPGGPATYVCIYTGGYLAGQTTVQYDWIGTDIRYHSDTYSKVWGDDTSEPSYEAADGAQVSPLITLGPDATGRLAVYSGTDATPVAAMEKTVPLAPTELRSDHVDPTCTPGLFPPLTCWESHIRITGLFGFTDFGSWPM